MENVKLLPVYSVDYVKSAIFAHVINKFRPSRQTSFTGHAPLPNLAVHNILSALAPKKRAKVIIIFKTYKLFYTFCTISIIFSLKGQHHPVLSSCFLPY